MLNIGLFGFGTVGRGLYEVIKTSGSDVNISRVGIRNLHKQRNVKDLAFTTDRNALIFDSRIDVIVEATDDAVAGFEIIAAALRQRKPVVTASKKLVAEYLPVLLQLQEEYETPILWEAACGAGIPILRTLDQYYRHIPVKKVRGILNGSTNYILSKQFRQQLSFVEALAEAQELGFAESDPSLDVDGMDPAYKLVLLCLHAFGKVVDPKQVERDGIRHIRPEDHIRAFGQDRKIKLVAEAEIRHGEIRAVVRPELVAPGDPLFHVDDVNNGICVETIDGEVHSFAGHGAGGVATGLALLADVLAVDRGYRYALPEVGWKISNPVHS